MRINDHCRVRVGVRVRNMARIRVILGIALWLQIVVYKLLEKVTKCGSIT